VLDTIVAQVYVIVYVLALSSDSGFPGFGCPEWFFSSLIFHFVNKIYVLFKFCTFDILIHVAYTHG
jgi:hypothetical protein